MMAGLTITTVYTTLGHEAMLHGLVQTEAEIIFVDWEYYETLKGTLFIPAHYHPIGARALQYHPPLTTSLLAALHYVEPSP